MYTQLNEAFPQQQYFYTVNGLTMADALEKCARLTGENSHVFNYQGQVIFAVNHDLGSDIEFLTPVSGSPVAEVTPAE
jgi:hypothetical protein